MTTHILPKRLAGLAGAALVLAACGLVGTPAVAPPPVTQAPATAAATEPPATDEPATEAPTEAATDAPTDEPPPTDADVATMVPLLWNGYIPPFTVEELCGLLTTEEINLILEWEWQLATGFSNASGCVHDTVDLHTGALVRLTNTPFSEDEFRGFYPEAMDLDGILLGDAYGRGRLDAIWIEVTGLNNLHLEIFATPITEEQSLALVEAVFPPLAP